MVRTPSNKSPVRAMPESRQEEDNKCVADDDEFLVAVGILYVRRDFRTTAAERDIYVVPEPSGKRYMPASPKFRYVAREIGVVEVTH